MFFETIEETFESVFRKDCVFMMIKSLFISFFITFALIFLSQQIFFVGMGIYSFFVSGAIAFTAAILFMGLFVFTAIPVLFTVSLFFQAEIYEVMLKNEGIEKLAHVISTNERVMFCLKFFFLFLILNLICLILFYWIPLINVIVFYSLNSYLLIKAYMRFYKKQVKDPAVIEKIENTYGMRLFLYGIFLVFVLTIPVINFILPIPLGVFMARILHKMGKAVQLTPSV